MSSTGDQERRKAADRFTTTHWSAVIAAGDDSSARGQEALERLCRAYWYPLYAYVRRTGLSPQDAEDLTQSFFARFLEKKYVQRARRERGRFRSFLLTSLKHFLVNEWHRVDARKRGGRATHVPFDQLSAERLYSGEPVHELTAERIYERTWALTLLEQARARLREEYAAEGKAERFAAAEQFLPGEPSGRSYAEAAQQLAVPEGTLKSDVHRLKQRYGDLLRAEILHTVRGPEEVGDELRYLMQVLSG